MSKIIYNLVYNRKRSLFGQKEKVFFNQSLFKARTVGQ